MMAPKLPPIPTAFGQRLLEFRVVFLPALVFGGAILLTAVLWQGHNQVSVTDSPEGNGLAIHGSDKPTGPSPAATNAPGGVVNVLQHENEPLHSGSRELSDIKMQTAHD